jgi:F-type H+-transporting ATPase subunit c
MKSKVMFLTIAAVLLLAAPVFAQTPDATAGIGRGELTRLGALIGMGLAAGLCGTGQGKAVASAAEGIARNPGAQAAIQTLMILGLAFIESLAIFTLLIVFLRSS